MSKIVSFVGTAGSGKTTIARALIMRVPETQMVVSYTTREPRPSDIPGEYASVTEAEFLKREQSGAFLWAAQYVGYRYGTTAESIREIFDRPDTIGIMILLPQMVEQLKSYLTTIGKESALVPLFITPPSKESLRARLEARGDSKDQIARRLAQMDAWDTFRRETAIPFHDVLNTGDIETAITEVLRLI